MLLGHVAEAGVDERIREVGDPGEIERNRLYPLPDTFDSERTELVPDVPISEKFAEFGNHLEFEFHRCT